MAKLKITSKHMQGGDRASLKSLQDRESEDRVAENNKAQSDIWLDIIKHTRDKIVKEKSQ